MEYSQFNTKMKIAKNKMCNNIIIFDKIKLYNANKKNSKNYNNINYINCLLR